MNQMLLCREDIENIANFPQGQEESRQFRESIQYMHVNLCKRAIADGKIIVSIDNILCKRVNWSEFLHSTIGSACKCSSYSAWPCFSSLFGVLLSFFSSHFVDMRIVVPVHNLLQTSWWSMTIQAIINLSILYVDMFLKKYFIGLSLMSRIYRGMLHQFSIVIVLTVFLPSSRKSPGNGM